jgi:hypothetical protein
LLSLLLAQMVDDKLWISSFEEAIKRHDADSIRELLQNPPSSDDIDLLKQILLLTMDAEIILCEMRQKLVNERNVILSYS